MDNYETTFQLKQISNQRQNRIEHFEYNFEVVQETFEITVFKEKETRETFTDSNQRPSCLNCYNLAQLSRSPNNTIYTTTKRFSTTLKCTLHQIVLL